MYSKDRMEKLVLVLEGVKVGKVVAAVCSSFQLR